MACAIEENQTGQTGQTDYLPLMATSALGTGAWSGWKNVNHQLLEIIYRMNLGKSGASSFFESVDLSQYVCGSDYRFSIRNEILP